MTTNTALDEAVMSMTQLVAACDRLAHAADAPGSIAPAGTGDWLRWLRDTISDRLRDQGYSVDTH